MTAGAAARAADLGSGPPAKRRADGLTFSRRAAVAHLRAADAALDLLIEAVGPFTVRPDSEVDPFAYLLRSIVYQQLNGTAAATIHARVLALLPGGVPDPAALLALDATELRAAGLSGNKTLSAHDLARHAVEGTLPTAAELYTLDDVTLVEQLTAVRGIGPWTVHMLMLFQLGRPDVLATGDFGVRDGYRLLHGQEAQPTPTQFRAATEHWRPYRSVASWYMWRAVDLHRLGELTVVR